MTDPSGEPLRWSRLYVGAAVAGAGLGLLVALDVLPDIPPQLTAWVQQVSHPFAIAVLMLGGALVGLALVAIAQLGVRWQLRQRQTKKAGD
jgi:hypothetical protein